MQGYLRGPFWDLSCFFLYVNSFVDDMECFVNPFTDDTSVQKSVLDITSFDKVNRDLQRLTVFEEQWFILLKAIKTGYMVILRQPKCLNHPHLFLNGEKIPEVDNHTHLGVTICDYCLSQCILINRAIAKPDRRLNIIRRCQKVLPSSCKEMLYKTTIRPVLDYSDTIYDTCLKMETGAIEKCQR